MEKVKAGGGKGKQPSRQGEAERTMKHATVKSSAGLMDKDVSPKKGKQEY